MTSQKNESKEVVQTQWGKRDGRGCLDRGKSVSTCTWDGLSVHTPRGVSWEIWLFSVLGTVLVLFAAPAASQAEGPDENGITVEAPSEDGTIDIEPPSTPTPARSELIVSESRDTEEGAPKVDFAEVSNSEERSAVDSTTVEVYRSGDRHEYHWQPDCALGGKGQRQAVSLAEAKEQRLIECGVCHQDEPEGDDVEKREKPQYLGNRRAIDNSWRRPVENHWRESAGHEWRLNSQATSAWRDGRN